MDRTERLQKEAQAMYNLLVRVMETHDEDSGYLREWRKIERRVEKGG